MQKVYRIWGAARWHGRMSQLLCYHYPLVRRWTPIEDRRRGVIERAENVLSRLPFSEQVACLHKIGGSFLTLVPEPGEMLCFAAVRLDPANIAYVAAPSEQLCLAAVRARGTVVRHLTQRSALVCLAAVENNGYALQHLRREERTREIVLAAVRQNGRAIAFLTDEERADEEILLEAVRQNGLVIGLIDERHRTRALCKAAVQRDPGAWKYIERLPLQ